MKKHLLALMMVFGGLLINAQNIYTGQTIEQNRKYWASNNRYYLIFQNDGNLVLYNKAGVAMWDTGTNNKGTRAVFQDDGNLVVYTPGNGVAFSSNTNGRRAERLTIQDDGNLVIYNGSNPLWASKSDLKNSGRDNGFGRGNGNISTGYKFRKGGKVFSPNGSYYLTFQNDGNLVLSYDNGDAIWASGTDNKGSRAEFQTDGNLVVYDSYNKAVWSSNTSRRGANKLSVQNDGNLVVYSDNSPLWSSGTNR